MDSLIAIDRLTKEEYVDAVFRRLGKGRVYAQKIYSARFKKGERGLKGVEPQAEPLVREILAATAFFEAPVSSVREEGGVTKFLLRYPDGLESESVILPMKFGFTLCVSSQVGCKMGCAFCETGKMGLLRSLETEEIVFQLFAARFVFGVPIRNVVFMGMGEPFDNYESVMRAVGVMTDPSGFCLRYGNITVSTSGRTEEIVKFAREAHPSLKLAVSLNAPSDAIRSKLMPVNRSRDLAALKEAMLVYAARPGRRILIEYVLLKGRNDSPEDAEAVATYLEGIPVTVNLIPYNSQKKGVFEAPSEEVVASFRDVLNKRGYRTLLRIDRGRGIMAACGQLGNRSGGESKICLRKQNEVL